MSNETKNAAAAASGARVRRDYETRAAAIRERAKAANADEVRELWLAAVNTAEMYHSVVKPMIATLRRHAKRGEYSEAGAIVAWRRAADELARQYCRIYDKETRAFSVFSVADRCAVAVELENSERENVFYGLPVEGRAE